MREKNRIPFQMIMTGKRSNENGTKNYNITESKSWRGKRKSRIQCQSECGEKCEQNCLGRFHLFSFNEQKVLHLMIYDPALTAVHSTFRQWLNRLLKKRNKCVRYLAADVALARLRLWLFTLAERNKLFSPLCQCTFIRHIYCHISF